MIDLKKKAIEDYKDGDPIFGTINEIFVVGHLCKGASGTYFCQDICEGATAPTKHGHAFSWSFNNSSLDVRIFDDSFYKDLGIQISQKNHMTIIKNPGLFEISFIINHYPACCGAYILSDISIYGGNKCLSDSKIKSVVKNILTGTPGNLTVILKDREDYCNFFEKMGFNRINTFYNSNTDNTLHMYSYNIS